MLYVLSDSNFHLLLVYLYWSIVSDLIGPLWTSHNLKQIEWL